ncbi:MAG: hypothetical protein QW776_04520 [Candidatus Nitrosocaldus sp.]
MIEALIVAAALAGAVTTLVRRSRSIERDRDREVYGRTLYANADGAVVDAALVQEYVEGKKGRMQKNIEHRIRSIADIRLRKYLDVGRISEEEYRALTNNNSSSNNNAAVYNEGSGYRADYTEYGSASVDNAIRIRIENNDNNGNNNNNQNDSRVMMQEILLKLDRLHSRLDVLEGKIRTSVDEEASAEHANPVLPVHVQGQEYLYTYKRYKNRDSPQVQRRIRLRGRSMDGKGRDKNKNEKKKEKEEEEKNKRHDDEYTDKEMSNASNVVIVDVVDDATTTAAGSTPTYVKDTISIGREEGLSSVYTDEHDLRQGNNRKDSRDDSNMMVSSSNSSSNVNAFNDEYRDEEELESIKKQIMDVLARLEKNE